MNEEFEHDISTSRSSVEINCDVKSQLLEEKLKGVNMVKAVHRTKVRSMRLLEELDNES